MFKNNLITRIVNNFYNYCFIKFNFLDEDLSQTKFKKIKVIKNIDRSKGYETVWLLNLKRLYDIFSRYKNPKKYNFVDIGCGYGIALIFACKKFNFLSYNGIDIIDEYLQQAKKNIFLSGLGNKKIKLYLKDAENFKIKNKPHFLFFFNPFDKKILNTFLEKNYSILKKTNSVIAYSNYKNLNILKKYSNNIKYINKYKLALIFF